MTYLAKQFCIPQVGTKIANGPALAFQISVMIIKTSISALYSVGSSSLLSHIVDIYIWNATKVIILDVDENGMRCAESHGSKRNGALGRIEEVDR